MSRTAPVPGPRGGQFADIPPNQTLFVKNLNGKLKLHDLKANLYELFTRYGDIHEVVASLTPGKRGFAFVVFHEIGMATNALRALQNYKFFERELVIAYAKTKSDVVAREQGVWKPREKKAEEGKQKEGAKESDLPKEIGDAKPGCVLFAENLPPDCTEVVITMLFRQYPGFEEVRLIAQRRVAFVQFKEQSQAEQAMNGLQKFMVAESFPLKLSFAKKS